VTRSPLRRIAAGAAMSAALALTACSSSGSNEGAQAMHLTEAGSSRFDEAGVEAIKDARSATLDLASGALTKSDIGLADDAFIPMVTMDDTTPLEVTVRMPEGEVVLETPTLKLFDASGGAAVDAVTLFRVFDEPDDLVAEVVASVDAYGVQAEAVDQWVSDVGSGLYASHDTALPIGRKLGSGVQISVNWDEGDPRQVLEYTITPAT
jgi:hypothetical protein